MSFSVPNIRSSLSAFSSRGDITQLENEIVVHVPRAFVVSAFWGLGMGNNFLSNIQCFHGIVYPNVSRQMYRDN